MAMQPLQMIWSIAVLVDMSNLAAGNHMACLQEFEKLQT